MLKVGGWQSGYGGSLLSMGDSRKQRHLGVKRRSMLWNQERQHANRALRIAQRPLTRRTPTHMGVDQLRLFGVKGTQCICGGQIVDV
jgi:hypothetical protein